MTEILSLKETLDDRDAKLEIIGFEFHGDDLRIVYDAPANLQKSYEAALAKLAAAETENVNVLSKSLANIWAVTTVPEAKQMIEALSVWSQ